MRWHGPQRENPAELFRDEPRRLRLSHRSPQGEFPMRTMVGLLVCAHGRSSSLQWSPRAREFGNSNGQARDRSLGRVQVGLRASEVAGLKVTEFDSERRRYAAAPADFTNPVAFHALSSPEVSGCELFSRSGASGPHALHALSQMADRTSATPMLDDDPPGRA
jgi:hypothetical protein